MLPNVPAFAVAFLGILRAGAVAVPLNPQFKEAELDFHFRECGVRALITDVRGAAVAGRLDDPPELLADLGALIDEGGAPRRRRGSTTTRSSSTHRVRPGARSACRARTGTCAPRRTATWLRSA